MKRINFMLMVTAGLLFLSCNESRRGNDSNLNETLNEAAFEKNADKLAGKRRDDAEFVYDMVASNYGEIKLAELANQRARGTAIKQIAQQLQTDHTRSLNELKTMAQAAAIEVPVEETDAARRTLENVAEESNEDFEVTWCSEMIDLHKMNIAKFEKRLADTEDAALKDFIRKTLPILRHHHQTLKACMTRIEKARS